MDWILLKLICNLSETRIVSILGGKKNTGNWVFRPMHRVRHKGRSGSCDERCLAYTYGGLTVRGGTHNSRDSPSTNILLVQLDTTA